jgi:UDP-N-acetylmuramate dehydrogenase
MNIRENFSLQGYNTFGINATAKYFMEFHSIDELKQGLQFHNNLNMEVASPLILGGGSNILLTQPIKELVLKNNILGVKKINEDADYVYLQVGAGESWHRFVDYCLKNNYAGVENLSLIPGNVGASPMQNIGAYGVELKDVFHSLEAYHLKDKFLVEFSSHDCEFGYRESVFKNKYKNQFAITSVSFRLNKYPVFHTQYGAIEQQLESMGVRELSIQKIAEAVISIRRSKLPDPVVIGNAGSFFKNPTIPNEKFQQLAREFAGIVGYPLEDGNTKLAAGWLIEQCGWKGYRKGDAGCHERQALVLVNYGSASGRDILALSEKIIDSVLAKFSIVLEQEVNIL